VSVRRNWQRIQSPRPACPRRPLTPALSPQAGRGRNPAASIDPMSDALGPRHGGRSEISDLSKIAIIVCYQTGMMRFIFDLGIRLVTFVALAAAFFRARNRPLGWVVAFPCQFPAGRRGRGNVVPASRASYLAQVIDYTRNYRQNRLDFGAEIKILPDLREREPAPLGLHAAASDSQMCS
jgi:hypothetical protein